jgi:hypothetical protein
MVLDAALLLSDDLGGGIGDGQPTSGAVVLEVVVYQGALAVGAGVQAVGR